MVTCAGAMPANVSDSATRSPVVPVTETLPAGEDYLSWMGGNLDAVVAALSA